jgi:hypothetical protein
MSDEHIRIERAELFSPDVDKALARERAGRERIIADTPPVSPVRRLLLNSLFYLPLAAVIGALTVWLLLEPKIEEMPIVGGEVELVNVDPFDTGPGVVVLTVGSHEVYVITDKVAFEQGDSGEAAFKSFDEIQVGSRVEVAGLPQEGRLIAIAIRPTADATSRGGTEKPMWPMILLFPLTGAFIAFALLFAEGLTTRNWVRMIERAFIGSLLAALFCLLAFVPAGMILRISQGVLDSEVEKHPDLLYVTIKEVSGTSFIIFAACRSAAWACLGAALGLGLNLVRSTRPQLRNSVIGGALGGAFGGLFFDPIDRWGPASAFAGSELSRLIGLLVVGLSIGIFVALIERLARDAWLRVRTGPLAGKSFILYKTPTVIGSDPACDVYLYKDAELDARHASLHRVGTVYEIEDMGSRHGTKVGGTASRRRRLVSGDQIIVGNTILDFEERQKRKA